MTEYYMFMHGWNSTGGGNAPYLLPVELVSEEMIQHFFNSGADCEKCEELCWCGFRPYETHRVKPIPSEFGRSQIIRKMFFNIEQHNGGIAIGSNGEDDNDYFV